MSEAIEALIAEKKIDSDMDSKKSFAPEFSPEDGMKIMAMEMTTWNPLVSDKEPDPKAMIDMMMSATALANSQKQYELQQENTELLKVHADLLLGIQDSMNILTRAQVQKTDSVKPADA